MHHQEKFISQATHISCDDERYLSWLPWIASALAIFLAIPLGVIALLWYLKRADRLDAVWIYFAVLMDTYTEQYWCNHTENTPFDLLHAAIVNDSKRV